MTRGETLDKIKDYLEKKGINIETSINGSLIRETIEQVLSADNYDIEELFGGLTIIYESKNWKKLSEKDKALNSDLSKVYLNIKVLSNGELVIKYGDLSDDIELLDQDEFSYYNSKYSFKFDADGGVNFKILRILNCVSVDDEKIAHSKLSGLVVERNFNVNGYELNLNTKNYEDTSDINLTKIPFKYMLTGCDAEESLTNLTSEYEIIREQDYCWQAREILKQYNMGKGKTSFDTIILDNSDGFKTLSPLKCCSKHKFKGNIKTYVDEGITNLSLCGNQSLAKMPFGCCERQAFHQLFMDLIRKVRLQWVSYEKLYPTTVFPSNKVPAIASELSSNNHVLVKR